MKPIDRPFVFILWVDAVTRHGWEDVTEGTPGVERVWSCGWQLERTATEVKLAADVGAEGADTNRRIAIPMQMVDEIRAEHRAGPILFERKKRAKRAKVVREVPSADA